MRKTILETRGNFAFAKLGTETYRFNVWIFRTAILLMILYFFVAWGINGFGNPRAFNFYYTCPKDIPTAVCYNPYYNADVMGIGWEELQKSNLPREELLKFVHTKEFYPGYELGKKPSPLYTNGETIYLLILVLAFIINHLLYNKGFNWKRAELKTEEAEGEIE